MNKIEPLVLSALLALTGCSAPSGEPRTAEVEKPALGLSTTLPIYWTESGDMAALLSEEAEPGPTRQRLEERFTLLPLDFLSEEALAPFDHLMLAQPRALSAEENVALDDWVRKGGRLLLFADPMLTMHSQFPIGDPRRPQDVALLSPILARWGLELTFDPAQTEGERNVEAFGVTLPVNLAGAFRTVTGQAVGECALSLTGLVARCRVGEGRATMVADAALFDEDAQGGSTAQGAALDALIDIALIAEGARGGD